MRFKRGRGPLRAISAAVAIILVASTLAVFFVVRSVVTDQQRRLLVERGAEASAVLGTLFDNVVTALPTLAGSSLPAPGDTTRFESAARPYLGLISTIEAFRPVDGTFTVLAGVGVGPGGGQRVGGDQAALARRSLATNQVVDGITTTAAGPRLSFALAAPGGLVLFETIAFDPSKPYDLGKNGPFSDLDGVLYASTQADPSTLVISTAAHLPLTGSLQRQDVPIGTQHWLLIIKSRAPLVGSFAAASPWGVLAAGLLAALLTTGLVETLGRRRAYALALVKERTSALQTALDEQARLEQGQRQAREAAEAANRAKTEFLSRMSHELRTPLNAILGFGQLLELDQLDHDQQESVDQILKGGRHLLGLINEVLDISRIEAGTLSLSPEAVDIPEVIGDILTLMGPTAQEHGIRIGAELDDVAGKHALADRQRLKQVLLNLVSNAIKYNREGGTVTVSCDVTDSSAGITVADTGVGIRAEDLDRLFVPFDRLGAEQSEVPGTGVGLALSRRLVEAMGGEILVESTRGEGSRFTVQMPLVEGPLERYERLNGAKERTPAGPDSESRANKKVLYIEDNLANLRLLERVLADYSHVEVIPAMQGQIGIALAREHQPAVILLDRHLPDLPGDDVLRTLRQDPLTAGIPIVMLSADATPGQIERLLSQGADAYLTKPFDIPDLLAVLTDQLNQVVA